MSGPSSYQPNSAIERWLDKRLPILRLMHDSFVSYPTPRNLNYWWTFGAILSLCLGVQIITGIVLAMHYVPSAAPMADGSQSSLAFGSVQRTDRDVPWGWLIQNIHSVGASMFFIAVYIHMFRGLYYGSYKAPREVLWILGCLIYLIMVATAFLGYTLPWGQMSFWGATVITNVLGAVPFVGESIKNWLMGGFAIDQPTLNRFFSLHYLLPFVIAGVVVLHVWALHESGQNNPTGVEVKSKEDTVPFTPYATLKDLFATSLFMLMFAVFVFYLPDALGHADNFIPANPLQTPPEIVPEWYLLPFYAILRAIDFNIGPIDSKLGGVIAMFGAIAVLFLLPWLDTSKIKSMRYRPVARLYFLLFVAACLGLGWCGAKNPSFVIGPSGTFTGTVEWISGATPVERPVEAANADAMTRAVRDAEKALAAEGAQIVHVVRSSDTVGVAYGVSGEIQSANVSGHNAEELEAAISAAKASVTDASFVRVTRGAPFQFTVTRLAQLLTGYYFLFFLIILPLLGLREAPSKEPASISEAIARKSAKGA